MFNFNAASEVSVSGSNFLQGDKIHNVMLKSIELKMINGKNDMQYQVIDFNYEGQETGGAFQDRVFVPNGPEINTRKQMEWGPVASEIEKLMMKLYLVISVIDPATYQDIRTKKKTINFSTIDQLIAFMQETLKGKEDVVFEAKMLKNNNGYAEFPRNFAKISKEGNLYMSNTFLGNGLRFSKYEATKIAERAEATPDSVDSFDLGDATTEANNVTFDGASMGSEAMPMDDDTDLNF